MDDVDEEELSLAMSTELSRPIHILERRRTRSLTSLQDAQVFQGQRCISLADAVVPRRSDSTADYSI
jgi:hypothetical protein